MLINESGCAERGQNMSEMIRKKLPIGIESFEEIRTEGFYYIDKTGIFDVRFIPDDLFAVLL